MWQASRLCSRMGPVVDCEKLVHRYMRIFLRGTQGGMAE